MRKRMKDFCINNLIRKIVSFCLALTMILTMLPSSVFSTETDAAESKTIKIHYNNTQSNWGNVYGYTWNTDGTETLYSGGWPGTKISKNSENANWYTMEVSGVTATNIGVIFNNGSGGSGNQTNNIYINGLTDGGEYWVWYDSYDAPSYSAPDGWVTSAVARDITIHYKNTNNWSTVSGYAWANSNILNSPWPGNSMTADSKHSEWYTMTLKGVESSQIGVVFSNKGNSQTADIIISNIPTENAQYWYDGSLSSSAPLDWIEDTTTSNCKVTFHFANTCYWNAVCLYAWRTNGSSSNEAMGPWPGTVITRDADGYYTTELNYSLTKGENLGYIFTDNNGNQTVDATIDYTTLSKGNVELWVQPGPKDDNGKYTVTTVDDENNLCISPEVNGTSVTFRYAGKATSSVYVCGTMNNWSTNSNYKMKKGADGIWSVTATLAPGTYQYKLVVDGNWINDSMNPVMVGNNDNNVLIVSDNVIQDTITVKLHFLGQSGFDYSSWVARMWCDDFSDDFSFEKLNGELVATVTNIPSDTLSVGYIIHKSGSWEDSDREFTHDRFVDLSQIKSGTVHYYVTSGVENGVMVADKNVVNIGKVTSTEYDFDKDSLKVYASLPITDYEDISIYDSTGKDSNVSISNISSNGSTYILGLNKEIDIQDVFDYRVTYDGYTFTIDLDVSYTSERFLNELTYDGKDLGSTWSKESTTFKVWAPTAEFVKVQLYSIRSKGSYYEYPWYSTVDMTRGEYGVWTVTINGDLNGVYYDYYVKVNGHETNTIDPYAKAGNKYGNLAMVINLDSTDPMGWEQDVSPNKGMSYNDAIIYEMSIRDFSSDDSSGISDQYQGKFLGLTEKGTTTNGDGGHSTGLDYLIDLGVTHLQLMPITDFNTEGYYSWGYDVKNHNFPEDSYSTDPYHGEVRVEELKEMVQTLHKNGMNVVMDVVYNHVYDGGSFCFNKLVPGYFSRMQADGSYHSCSGCGNDTATENKMVRKYIVESILYWIEEYHIDGFRFDMAGNIDTETIKAIEYEVHQKYPYIILYGEGWSTGADNVAKTTMATKYNSWITGYFGYFSDNIREHAFKFATGNSYRDTTLEYAFKSIYDTNYGSEESWTKEPTRVVNYVACHDGYTLTDKLLVNQSDTKWSDLVKMGNLASSIALLAEGIPFIHAGDEFLREKVDENGIRHHNSYDKPDSINSMKWTNLDDALKSAVSDYYKGLIEFRKNHAALRMTSAADVASYVHPYWINDNVLMYYIDGNSIYGEVSDGIIIVFNNSSYSQDVNFYEVGANSDINVWWGDWKACVDSDYSGIPLSGTDVLYTISNGSMTVDPYSTTVLVLGDTVDTDSVYTKNAVVEDASRDITIHFKNNSNWDAVNGYGWYTVGVNNVLLNDGWPGAALTKDFRHSGWYTMTLTDVTSDNIGVVFSNNGSSQTADIIIENIPTENAEYWYDGSLYTYATDSWKESVIEKFDISFSRMIFGNSLDMNFAFKQSHVSDWTGYYVVVTKTYADSKNMVETYYYDNGDWTSTTINGYPYYYVTFDGIAAKEMADKVCVIVYNSEGEEVSNTYEDSVRDYAMRALADTSNGDACKTMIVDMLNYGAAAQEYFAYNEEDLANNQLSTKQQSYATKSVSCTDSREMNENYCFGTSLIFESNISMQVAFKNITTDMNVVITYTDHYGIEHEVTVSGSEFRESNGYYIVKLDALVIADGHQTVTFTVYDANKKVVTTVKDSIESYLKRANDIYGDDIFYSLMKFSDSAYAYLHLNL